MGDVMPTGSGLGGEAEGREPQQPSPRWQHLTRNRGLGHRLKGRLLVFPRMWGGTLCVAQCSGLWFRESSL
jgi:hypothetical protein